MRRRTLLKASAGALPMLSLSSAATADVETQSAPYEPLDSVDIEGAREAAVHHDNEIVYLATTDGFAVVDITDPGSLDVLAERRGIDLGGSSTLTTLYDVWPWEDRLLVSGPAQADPESATGFALFDISDPASPEKVTAYETNYYIHNSYFDDGMIYLVGSSLYQQESRIPLVIYDFDDDEVEEINRWSPIDHDEAWGRVPLNQRNLHDVTVQDGIAYLPYWDAGAWLLDVSDPEAPEVLDRVGDFTREELAEIDLRDSRTEAGTPPGNAHYTAINEEATVMVVGKEAWSAQEGAELIGGAGGVDLWDISDKTDVEHLAHIEAPEAYGQMRESYFTTSHNCDIADGWLYTSWYFGGVKVHDISDPENPEELAWWRSPTETSFWTAQAGVPGEFFVASSADVLPSDLRQPVNEGLYTFPARAGEQPDPPDLNQSPSALNDAASTPTETPANGGDDSNDSTPTREGTTPTGAEPTQTATDTDDDDGPGFGIGGALTAIGGAGYMLKRRLGDDSERP